MDKKELTALIQLAQKGNADAFEDLVNAHYETMFKMAYKWCGNKSDAEDITQESCIKLARGIKSFRFDSAFTSWLYKIVINAAKDWYKAQSRLPSSSVEMESVPSGEMPDDKLYALQVLHEIHRLPVGEKDAVILVLGEGLSHKEAADILDCKESTVSWRVHEARRKLSALFEKGQKYG